MKEITWEIVLQAACLLGTGGWLGYVVIDHGRRLIAIKKAIDDKASEETVASLAKNLKELERAMPQELRGRLRTVENEKLGAREHAKVCATALRTIETMIGSLKDTVDQHNKRLTKGDDLFRELSSLAGEMRGYLRNAKEGGT
jgi:hypothetical protein